MKVSRVAFGLIAFCGMGLVGCGKSGASYSQVAGTPSVAAQQVTIAPDDFTKLSVSCSSHGQGDAKFSFDIEDRSAPYAASSKNGMGHYSKVGQVKGSTVSTIFTAGDTKYQLEVGSVVQIGGVNFVDMGVKAVGKDGLTSTSAFVSEGRLVEYTGPNAYILCNLHDQ